MSRVVSLTHEFVEYIPDRLVDGVLYISIPYATAVHRCCCGCGNKVVTPISPTDWTLIFDGRTVSLDPSIGNWNFKCRSHYWIQHNKIMWARQWTNDMVNAGRARDRHRKDEYIHRANQPRDERSEEPRQKESRWGRLFRGRNPLGPPKDE